jgi:rhodanese-related sulfurtransferase
MMNQNPKAPLPQALQAALSGDSPPLLVDVREYPEFAAGHIREARCMDLGEFAGLPKETRIVCVCRSGRRSAEAAARLTELGFPAVDQLAGGMEDWEKAGLPVEREAHAPRALERQVRLSAGLLLLLGLSLSYLWPPAIILAWFVPAGLVFAALTDSCAMGMLLAKAPWNRRG